MVTAYLARYGGTLDQISADIAEAYSVGQVAYQAITKIKSLDNAKLMTELHSCFPPQGCRADFPPSLDETDILSLQYDT